MQYTLDDLIRIGAEAGASDVHIAVGVPVKYRIDGQLQNLFEYCMTAEDCEEYARQMAGEQYDDIRYSGEVDASTTLAGERVRINLFRSKGNISASLRILANHIPDLDKLGLPPAVSQFSTYDKGIILVTGETGSGKSTTLAAILDKINHTRRQHIITLEDPIEYVYEPDMCLINQREVGQDTGSYQQGLRAILREDPDIILIGEMRDADTIETAMTAAETGHLVFATLHTNSAVDSVDRIVGTFPADKQPQVRMQLSTTLRAVLAQQLLVRKGGKGRAAACEVMIVNAAIRNQIREGNTPQMQSSLLSSANLGAITMDNCLLKMVHENIIDADTAVQAAINPDYIRQNVTGLTGSMGSIGGANVPPTTGGSMGGAGVTPVATPQSNTDSNKGGGLFGRKSNFTPIKH